MTATAPHQKLLLWPLAAALAVRLLCLPLAKLLPRWGDSSGYLYLAQEFAKWGSMRGIESGVRPPIPRVLTAAGLDTGVVPFEPYPGVFLVQIAAGLLACALLMMLTRRRFGLRAALATGWIYALYPPSVLWSASVMMVETFAVLASAAVLLALDALDSASERRGARSLPRAVLLGLILGLGILTKEQMLSVTAVVLLVLVLPSGVSLLRRVALALMVSATAFLLTLPWALHNQRTEGVFLISGTFGSLSMMADNAPEGRSGIRMWLAESTLAERVALSRRVMRDALLAYPALTAERAGIRLRIALGPEVMLPIYVAVPFDGMVPSAQQNFQLFREAWRMPPGTWGRRVQLLCGAAAVILFGLSAAGLAAAPRGTLWHATMIMTGVFLLSAALFVASARYRQSLIAFHLPFAGLALAALTDRAHRAGLDAAATRRGLRWGLAVGAILITTILLLPSP